MSLSVRRGPYVIPAYSLTGDLLAYLSCGLQYRYHNKGSLPPSSPVQLWFGQFIHGVMEEAYRHWEADAEGLPWDWRSLIRPIEEEVDKRRLRPKGLLPPPNLFDVNYERNDKRLASRRAEKAINHWGPHLFPLVERAEVKLSGIRPLGVRRRPEGAGYYEVTGVADVLSDVSIANADDGNLIMRALEEALGPLQDFGEKFEIIVDYKGMRRPPKGSPERQRYEWQLRTYAWLRMAQPDSRKVVAGVILYLNELSPSGEDLVKLQEELGHETADVKPRGEDLARLLSWRKGARIPEFTPDFVRDRSIMVVDMTEPQVESSLREFDEVVGQIEEAVGKEIQGRSIMEAWMDTFLTAGNDPPDRRYCTACDFKSFCPQSAQKGNPRVG